MTFLHPALALFGAACVAIPIIIHLLMHRRRKPLMWGAMRFLQEAYRRQRKRLMLEKWLLLAARCLLVLLLGLAIGRPLVGALAGAGASGGRTVVLVIDTSLASGVIDDAGSRDSTDATALTRHKAVAISVIDALAASSGGGADRVALVTTAFPAEGIIVPASSDLAAVRTIIENLEPAHSRADVAGALVLAAGAISGGPDDAESVRVNADRAFVVVLSDFHEGAADLSAALPTLPRGARLIATRPAAADSIGVQVGNVVITGVEPVRSVIVGSSAARGAEAVAGEQVRVNLRRSGEPVQRDAVSVVNLSASGTRDIDAALRVAAGTAQVRWAAGQEVASVIVRLESTRQGASATPAPTPPSESGSIMLTARIDDDALLADNLWRRPVEVREALRVGIVSPTRFSGQRADTLDAGAWARLALSPGEAAGGDIEIVEIEPASLDGARLAGLDAAVIARPDLLPAGSWPRLRVFVEGGGLLLIMPPSGVTVHLWPDAMVRELGLPWTLAREPLVASTPVSPGEPSAWSIATRSTPQSASDADTPGTTPAGTDRQSGETSPLLGLIAGELPELLPSARVYRALPPTIDAGAESAASAETPLVLDAPAGTPGAGMPLLWIGSPGQHRADPALQPSTQPATQASPASRGLIAYLSVSLDLDWTDVPTKPLMVPLMQELVRQGTGRARGSWWSVAGSRPSAPSRSAELVRVVSSSSAANDPGEAADARVGIDESGRAAAPLRHADVYRAVDERGGDRGVVAINPDPPGSRINPQPPEAVAQALRAVVGTSEGSREAAFSWLSSAADDAAAGAPKTAEERLAVAKAGARSLFTAGEQGSPLSLPLLVCALVLAVFESLMARRASHATVGMSINPILTPAGGRGLATGKEAA